MQIAGFSHPSHHQAPCETAAVEQRVHVEYSRSHGIVMVTHTTGRDEICVRRPCVAGNRDQGRSILNCGLCWLCMLRVQIFRARTSGGLARCRARGINGEIFRIAGSATIGKVGMDAGSTDEACMMINCTRPASSGTRSERGCCGRSGEYGVNSSITL